MRFGAIILLLVVGGGLYLLKEATKPPSPARQAYQDFAQLVADQKWDDATARATGSAVKYVDAKKKAWYQIARMIGPDTASKNYRETTGITYRVESETASGNSTSLTLIQTIEMRNPNSPSQVRYNIERHTVQVDNVGGAYKIASVVATKAE